MYRRIVTMILFVLLSVSAVLPVFAEDIKSLPLFVNGKQTNGETALQSGFTLLIKVPTANRITGTSGKINPKMNTVTYTLGSKPSTFKLQYFSKQPYLNLNEFAKAIGYESYGNPDNVLLFKKLNFSGKTAQYGKSSFDPAGFFKGGQPTPLGLNTVGSSKDIHVFEKGSLVYFFWHNPGDSFVGAPGPNTIYVSIAKNGSWVVRDKVVHTYDSNSKPEYLFFENNVLVKDIETGIKNIRVLEDGSLKENTVVSGPIDNRFMSITFTPVYTADSYGFLLKEPESKETKIYLAKNYSAPISVKDEKGILEEGMHNDRTNLLYLNQKNNQLYIFSPYSSLTFYDIVAGDMIYDQNGKDKKISIPKPNTVFKGKFVNWSNGFIRVFDENLKPINDTKLVLPEYPDTPNFFTITDKEIHGWQFTTYKRENSISLVSYKR